MTKMKCVALVCGMALVGAGAFAANLPVSVAELSVSERLLLKSEQAQIQSVLDKAMKDEAFAARAKLEYGVNNSMALRMKLIEAVKSPKSAAAKLSAEKFFAETEALVKSGKTTESGVAKIEIKKSDMAKDMIAAYSTTADMNVASASSMDAAKEAQIAIKNAGHLTGTVPAAEADQAVRTLEEFPELADTGTKLVCEEAAKNLQGKDGSFGPEQATNLVRVVNNIGGLLRKGVDKCKAGVQAVQTVLGKGPEVFAQIVTKCKVVKAPVACAL